MKKIIPIQIKESSLPDGAAALRMAQLLKMAQRNNSSHLAVLDMLVEQFSNVSQQLAIQTIVMRSKYHAIKLFSVRILQKVEPTPLRLDPLYVKVILMRVNILMRRVIWWISRCDIHFSSTWHTATFSSTDWPRSCYCSSWISKFTVGGFIVSLYVYTPREQFNFNLLICFL